MKFMKITLSHVHLFMILLLGLILSTTLGKFVREGFNDNPTYKQGVTEYKDVVESRHATHAQDNKDKGAVTGMPFGLSSGPVDRSTLQTTEVEESSETMDAQPVGVSKSTILPGEEDLYILKSEIVPPVCPACPAVKACPRQEQCPPCPPCTRCPEPSFECKKVPKYDAADAAKVPRPILTDFSQFGM